ncbi:MAG TPA: RluA family pseudouridine synthase [Terriglobia bacterium]|nr:RluA family pseudouridine synthase [Terriglobia bacterium]
MSGNASQETDLREFVAGAEDSGQRLDIFLAEHMPDWTRSQLQQVIRTGLVKIGGRAASKAGEKLEAGDRVSILAKREPIRAFAEELPLAIVYEDDDLAVVDKPAGMAVHIGVGTKAGTLVNALLYHLGGGLSSVAGELRPGIVHRLDKMTSGLIIVAKNDVAHHALADQFRVRTIHKHYCALVHGRVESEHGKVDAPVGRDPVRRARMKVDGIAAREAVTLYRVSRRFHHFTLIDAEPQTGRTHQIRVHFAHLHHPIVGDRMYGAPAKLWIGSKERPTLDRHFLHAAEIEFVHPRTGAKMKFTSPLPPDLKTFLELLEAEDR